MSRFLESKTKFSFHNHRAADGSKTREDSFARWSNSNFYRTSYNDMGNKKPCTRQSAVIPGYQGHVPRVGTDNMCMGKRMTEQSRDVLKASIIDKASNNFSTTGFNAKLIPKDDITLEVRSRRYGT